MRLIDADALKDHLEDLRSYTKLGEPDAYYRGETNALKIAIKRIDRAPTVDAVPVVRCVDCECFRPTGTNLNGYWFCQNWDMDMLEEATDPKRFYCADGKVKTYGEGQV